MTAQPDRTIEQPLTLTKLHRPRVGNQVVLRPRLTMQLEAAADLTLVIAPAGYGKTVLLSAWLQTSALPSAWLSLDEYDNDLNVFVSYLAAAVRSLFPTACDETLALLHGMTLPPVAVIRRSLLNELASIQKEFILVLDDYHVIHDRGIHEVMGELTRHPPPGLHLVFAARNDPALPLSSLRARGHLVELREADLRFSQEETANFLREEMQLAVDDQTVVDLTNYTEGWVAGLRLTALYIQHTGDISWLAADPKGYNRYVIDYLVAEVLARVPPVIQEFLLKTAILERFCRPLCEAVTGIADAEGGSEACLDWLEQNNLFLVSVDGERRWFRYHHLFRRLLLTQLEQQRGAAEVTKLHAKASDWFAQHGYAEEALQHALTAGDTAAAVEIVARYRRELTNEEQWQRLDRWVRLFPRQVVDREPELLLCEVWFMVNRQQLPIIPPVLDRIEALILQQALDLAVSARLQGEVDVRRATLYFYSGDHTSSMAAARTALDKIPEEWWLLRAQARLFLSAGYLATGQLKQAYATLYDSGEPANSRAAQMRLLVGACFIHWIAADLSGLAHAAALILANSDQLRSQIETTSWARYHWGACLYHWNDLVAAEQLLAAVVHQPYQTHLLCYINAAAALALIFEAQGHAERAREITARMVSHVLDIGGAGLVTAKAFQAELALRQGRLAEAVFWAENNDVPLAVPRPLFYQPSTTMAKVLLAQNTPASRRQAGQVLSQLHQYNASIHYTTVLIEVLALEALLHQAEGREHTALDALQQALDLAEPGGFVRTFVDLGEPMAQLLAALVRRRRSTQYAARILAAFPPKVAPMDGHLQANAVLLSPLTPRELEVLGLLNEHCTDNEIAATLVVSADTVHSHVQHIAEKLGVRGRRAIVRAAKDQGLLE